MTDELTAFSRLRLRARARVARDRAARRRLRPLRRRRVARRRRSPTRRSRPRPRSRSREVGQASAEDVGAAVAAARAAFEDGWSGLRPAERAKYLFRIARLLQERAREFAVLESLNGGKPIKESRDVDLPLAAAHFFYYAGWADKLEYAFPNRRPRPRRRGGPDHPVELPAADAGVEDRPGARGGQHGGAQAGRDDAAHRAAVLRRAAPGRAAARRREHRHRRRPHRRRARRAPRRRQDRVHRLDRGRQGDPARAGRQRQGADARARRQGRQHRVRRRAARPGGRGHRQRDLLQPGPRLLRGLAPARAGVDPAAADREAQAPARDAARRRPARQEHRRRRDQLRRAAAADRGARRGGRAGGRRDLPAAVPAARAGLLVRADRLHQRRAEPPDRAGGDLRPGALRAHLPHARGGDREGEQHRLRALGRRVDGEGLAHPVGGAAAARRRRVGEHVQPLRPDVAVRRLQGVGLRPRGRPARPRALPALRRHDPRAREARPTSSTWAARSRARSPAARTRRRTTTSPRPRARTCATRCGSRAARSASGPG